MKVLVKEVKRQISGDFHSDVKKHIEKVGDTTICKRCRNSFVIGQAELEKAKCDYKGNPKQKLECWDASESFVIDINLNETPIDFSKYTMKEQVVIFGVEALYTRDCPTCRENKGEIFEVEHTWGRPDRKFAE